MKRKVIKIDEELCNGCGLCAQACHEGAIGMIDGKAHLLRDDYCDGLGNCLPVCPTGAITFEEREAAEYDQAAVDQHLKNLAGTASAPAAEKASAAPAHAGCPSSSHSSTGGCPGSRSVTLAKADSPVAATASPATDADGTPAVSQLMQWPVQIKLLPLRAPYYEGAHLLIAADCAAFTSGDFHNRFMKNKITMIGCPKLDEGSYAEKLTAILQQNNIASVTVVRMEVPCCGGLANAAIEALKNCGKMIPWNVVTLSIRGEIIA